MGKGNIFFGLSRIILEPGQICPYQNNCDYTAGCQGCNPKRKTKFTCDFRELHARKNKHKR